MAIEGNLKCIQFLVCIVNFIFLLLGITLMIIGIVVTTQFADYIAVINNGFNIAPVLIIILGIIIALVSFFGCYGAMRQNRCMLNFFALLVFILLIAQIACIILALVKRGEVEKTVDDVLDGVVKNYLRNPSYEAFMDISQRSLGCCGAHNYTDYRDVFNATQVPKSCCKDESKCIPIYIPPVEPAHIYTEGCRPKVTQYMQARIGVVAGVAVAVCFIQILAVIFAMCLSRGVDRYEMV